MTSWIEVSLLAAMALFAYPFVLYPGLLRALRPRRKPAGGAGRAPEEWPAVAMVICAYNEERIIRQKLENCLALEYPAGKLRIVVVSDGSTDSTATLWRQFAPQGIELIEQKPRRGKVANLNEVIPARSEEIIVLSDANVLYRSDAILRLVSRFRDPTVGCVSGKVVLRGTTESLSGGEADYYSLEWGMQERESELHSMVGVDGAMYALRRDLFPPCPPDTLIEDFVIAVGVARQGKRVVFEPGAIGWEAGPATVQEEFRRKVRIAAGAAQALARGNGWPIGAPPRFWFLFLSHKLLRWISPLIGLAILVLSWVTRERALPGIVLAAFLVVAALAVLRAVKAWIHPATNWAFYFLFGQAATSWGLIQGMLGRQSVLWAKADR